MDSIPVHKHDSDSPQNSQRSRQNDAECSSAKKPGNPFQVICERCRKTIFFSGEGGPVTYVVCDTCSGI